MAWELSGDRPIYAQLVARLTQDILSGRFPPGGRLPSVRELASEAGVNPNTMQRALALLEQDGLACAQRTVGRTVTEDRDRIERAREELAQDRTLGYLADMEKLGYGPEGLPERIRTLLKERNE
ncbi:MAG: GntR family transcriptional regulator [Clostridiaceae bacterium]|nr:GntR family transcriptional regulator [Clostridiaceae bacterium]